ncbi:MAG: single-stranded DNA-binding protein, partial [Firmicutes bacterium]|nr:single-stranded DNA-binding protein [Bacillota bacterium]
MNSVHLVGRLTKDPIVQQSGKGNNYCLFSIAVDRGKNKNGDDLGADFPGVVCFGKTADNLGKYCKKGQLLSVEGKISTGRFEKDGKVHYTERVMANRIQFLARGKSAEDN